MMNLRSTGAGPLQIPQISEVFCVSNFTNTNKMVKLLELTTLIQASKLTIIRILYLSDVIMHQASSPLLATNSFQRDQPNTAKIKSNPLLEYPKTNPNPSYETLKENIAARRYERKSNGLYNYCDERYSIGHQFMKPRALYEGKEDSRTRRG